MPTENRSSNTEIVSELLPCPFCGEKPQITKHHREDIYSFMHRCPVLGPISWGFREDQQAHIEKWNARAQPAPQAHPDPIAWMVGTAFWWTKEEADRDAAATGLPIVGLGPMAGSADIDQLQLEIAKLQLDLTMHNAAAIQDECIRAENSELRARLDKLETPVIPELTDDLREILGRPNFTCHHIAKALRVMGLKIAPKSEDEQAVVIHWLLGIYLKHGADWRQRATADLAEAANTFKA